MFHEPFSLCCDAPDPGEGARGGASPAPGSAVIGDAGRRASAISPALAAGTGARAKRGGTLSPRVHMVTATLPSLRRSS